MNGSKTTIVALWAALVAATSADLSSPLFPAAAVASSTTAASTTGRRPDLLDLPIGPPGDDQAPARPHVGGQPADDPKDEPPPTIYGEEIDAETDTIVYVLDISGSMAWDVQPYTALGGSRAEGPRIDRARAELARSISGLPRSFRFGLVAYSCSTRRWQPELMEANAANKAAALAWAMALEPTDGTATGPGVALGLALDRGNKAVVLLTDGAPNCGTPRETTEEHRTMIRSANSQRAVITVFGIAAHGSWRAFCQAVASDSGGSYFDVP